MQIGPRFLWDVTTLGHPQFRELQQLLLQGCAVEDIRMDHVHMLNRRGPDSGRTWHAHPYDQDGWGVTERYSGLGLVRTLCYPQVRYTSNLPLFVIIGSISDRL